MDPRDSAVPILCRVYHWYVLGSRLGASPVAANSVTERARAHTFNGPGRAHEVSLRSSNCIPGLEHGTQVTVMVRKAVADTAATT